MSNAVEAGAEDAQDVIALWRGSGGLIARPFAYSDPAARIRDRRDGN